MSVTDLALSVSWLNLKVSMICWERLRVQIYSHYVHLHKVSWMCLVQYDHSRSVLDYLGATQQATSYSGTTLEIFKAFCAAKHLHNTFQEICTRQVPYIQHTLLTAFNPLAVCSGSCHDASYRNHRDKSLYRQPVGQHTHTWNECMHTHRRTHSWTPCSPKIQ